VQRLEAAGLITKVSRGLYRWNNLAVPNQMVEVGRLVPKGVFCLFSALAYYGLTTYIPHEYHLAIKQKEKISLPDYPPIKVYFWSRQAQEAGVVTHTVSEGDAIPATIRMYDVEKTIGDALKYRHKIGKDLVSEVLKNYLKRRGRNLDKLMDYAKVLRVEKILQEYLSVLL
jgi:predicted transcriptional regulator of viral defense system